MVYSIEGPGVSGAIFTADGVVTGATREFEWACGEPIAPVLAFFERQQVSWTVSDAPPRGLMVQAGVAEWMH